MYIARSQSQRSTGHYAFECNAQLGNLIEQQAQLIIDTVITARWQRPLPTPMRSVDEQVGLCTPDCIGVDSRRFDDHGRFRTTQSTRVNFECRA